uniref:Uncharacterized protein n=1 Tax=Cacopsylla melanoneura TaxID=428564 RepID=A0A8D9B8A5_9HEMI
METDKAQSEKMKTRWRMQKQGCLMESKRLGKRRKDLRATLQRSCCEKPKGLRERMKEYWMWKDKHRMEQEKKEEELKRQAMMYRCKVEGVPCATKTQECWSSCNLEMWLKDLRHAQ